MNLPTSFIKRMKTQLPKEEWEDFFAVYERPYYKGIRVNILKISPEEYEKISPFALQKIQWAENGYYIEERKAGHHPHHLAGLYYSQEPSAMSVVPTLQIQKGERVLDLCSAPGGKGTQAGGYLQGEGLICLNEPISSRAQILSSNVERMGIRNAVVINEYPETLALFFGEYFDKIIIDAPCSGEGMFRKNEKEAIEEWSEENVQKCAVRQKSILDAAAKMLKKGGQMVYSTCTFSKEEDEEQVEDFLANHPDFRLIERKKLYPHKEAGEGHFYALFKRLEGENTSYVKEVKGRVLSQSEKLYREFEKDFFLSPFAERLHEVGGVLYNLPKGMFDWKKLHLLRVGVKLGEIKNNRFEPSHSLAMCLRKEEVKRWIDFPAGSVQIEKYLHGETLQCEEENGWILVCADGYPVGLGKVVNGTMKNHLPKGLRF